MNKDDEYKVGYRKPPRERQFKKGQCANPKGRGYNQGPEAGELFVRVLTEPIVPSAGTKSPPIPRMQVIISNLGAGAVTGDLNCIETLIDWYALSANGGDFKGDGIKHVTGKSSRLLKVIELGERMNRRSSRRRRR